MPHFLSEDYLDEQAAALAKRIIDEAKLTGTEAADLLDIAIHLIMQLSEWAGRGSGTFREGEVRQAIEESITAKNEHEIEVEDNGNLSPYESFYILASLMKYDLRACKQKTGAVRLAKPN